MAQSSKGFDVTQPIEVKVDYVRLPYGGARVSILEHVKKRSIHTLPTDDNLCFPRSVVVGIANYKKRN